MSFRPKSTGPLAWMTRNSVAANLLMLALVVGGVMMGLRVKQEVFPEFDLDTISIAVPYPGASPSEVEQGIILAIEEAVRGVDGVKRVTSTANEGAATLMIELLLGADDDRALADVKTAVDRLTSLPEDAERPIVNLVTVRRQAIAVVVYGDLDEKVLRTWAERVRTDLLENPRITTIELDGVRPLEVSIEVPQAQLRAHDLTLEQIARTVRAASVELPGGGVKTDRGEILLRTTERRDLGLEFEDVVVKTSADGTQLRLGEIASIVDGFRDTDQSATYDGMPAARVTVYRVGDQTPIELADAVRAYVEEKRSELPPGLHLATWNDQSEAYRDRMGLLLNNGYLGLLLVFGVLGLFLEIRLAFWVTLGIPVSFLGSFMFLPLFDASVNMISLMAFIITLGMVVDDAIVVGENVYARRQAGEPPMAAAIHGVQEVAVPVIFSILTTVAAFSPLLFITGRMGKFMFVIPVIVISVLLLSLLESLLVLPAHLAHTRTESRFWLIRKIHGPQQGFSRLVERFIATVFQRVVRAAVEYRYLTIAWGVASLLVMVGLVAGGRVKNSFLPRIPSDQVVANVVMPFGANVRDTSAVKDRLERAAQEVIAELSQGQRAVRGMFATVGSGLSRRGPNESSGGTASHLAGVEVFLVPSDERRFGAAEFAARWRARVGEIPGVKSMSFAFQTGPSSSKAIEVQLQHTDIAVLERAAAETARTLATFTGVKDIDDGFDLGKPQLDFKLRPAARTVGLTESELGRQMRSAFFGAEALRQQRGRDELRVMVRLPESERQSEGDVGALILRTPRGGEVPLAEAASVTRGRAYTKITRVDGRRVVTVTADVDEDVANTQEVVAKLRKDVMPKIAANYQGLGVSYEGQGRERAESMDSMFRGFMVALVVIYALLAIPFGSYFQPLIIMMAIPFGFVGAVMGHLFMGFDISLISMMGMIALSGVTVNDSLVLVVAINRLRDDGMELLDAIVTGSMTRFRPIILTSLTTFLGLTPMIFETSVQARFLIPMALSLGFGVLFSTFVILVMVPALYGALEDVRRLAGVGPERGLSEAPPEEGATLA